MPVSEEKFAVTLSGALIVTVVEALAGWRRCPLQPVKEYPLLAVALIATAVPEL